MSPLFRSLALAVTVSMGATPALAADGSTCDEAAKVLGAKAVAGKDAAACEAALAAFEDEQWQLWLDLAFAEEATGNLESAIATYRKFIKATLRRGGELQPPWTSLREEAIFSVDRLERQLMQNSARVTLETVPPGLPVRFTKEARRGEEATPLTRYLPAGTHVIAVTDPKSGRAREMSFEVEVGQVREIKVDLREGSPVGLTERALPGDGVAVKPVAAGEGGGSEPGVPGVNVRHDEDLEAPPRGGTSRPALKRIGAAAIGVGVAATAVATGFLVTSIGLNDEADCAGALCDFQPATRARLRGDAGIAEDRALAGYIVGGAFLVGGAIALIIDALDDGPAESSPPASDKPATGDDVTPAETLGQKGPRLRSLAPMVGDGHAGVAASIGF